MWTSFHQFWDGKNEPCVCLTSDTHGFNPGIALLAAGFMEVLGQLELYLRVDGERGVIHVRKVAPDTSRAAVASDEE